MIKTKTYLIGQKLDGQNVVKNDKSQMCPSFCLSIFLEEESRHSLFRSCRETEMQFVQFVKKRLSRQKFIYQ